MKRKLFVIVFVLSLFLFVGCTHSEVAGDSTDTTQEEVITNRSETEEVITNGSETEEVTTKKSVTINVEMTIKDGELVWNKVQGVSGYVLFCDNKHFAVIDKGESNYSLEEIRNKLSSGKHTFILKAETREPGASSSGKNPSISIIKLMSPDIKKSNDGATLTWKPVDYAEMYDIYCDGEYLKSIESTSLSLVGFYGKTLKVVANSSKDSVLRSEPSNEIFSDLL